MSTKATIAISESEDPAQEWHLYVDVVDADPTTLHLALPVSTPWGRTELELTLPREVVEAVAQHQACSALNEIVTRGGEDHWTLPIIDRVMGEGWSTNVLNSWRPSPPPPSRPEGSDPQCACPPGHQAHGWKNYPGCPIHTEENRQRGERLTGRVA